MTDIISTVKADNYFIRHKSSKAEFIEEFVGSLLAQSSFVYQVIDVPAIDTCYLARHLTRCDRDITVIGVGN